MCIHLNKHDELYDFLLIDNTLELVKQSPLLFNACKSNLRYTHVNILIITLDNIIIE